MNYGGLWAARLFIAVDSSHENKPKGQNVKRLHTTEEREPMRNERGSMWLHTGADIWSTHANAALLVL